MLKSSEEILAESKRLIIHIHLRPAMFVSYGAPGSADALDGLFSLAHRSWASIQNRESECRQVVDQIRRNHKCGPFRFPNAYRCENIGSSEREALEHVQACWKEIGIAMKVFDVAELDVRNNKS